MPPATITLTCWKSGDDPDCTFMVEIENTMTVMDLRDAIKEKKKPVLDHVPANMLDLWKVSIPLNDERFEERLNALNTSNLTRLIARRALSSYFSEKSGGCLDIVIYVPSVSPERLDSNLRSFLTLSCLVLGDNISRIFFVEIAGTQSIAQLKDAIKEKKKHTFQYVDADTLDLWKVSLPVKDGFQDMPDGDALSPLTKLSEVFGEPPASNELHIIVKGPANTIPLKRALPESEDIFERLKRSKIATVAPSTTAKPDVYDSLQQDPSQKIFDDRPELDFDVPPISLLYEGFGHFLDIMDGRDDVPGLADIDVMQLHREVDQFAKIANAYYKNEVAQRMAVLPCINAIFAARRGIEIPPLSAASIESVCSDGHNIAKHGAGTIVVEFKKDIVGIAVIPHVELTCYIGFARLNAVGENEAERRRLFLGWRIPCVGLTIVGCQLTFYAAIAVDHRFKLVSLTSTLSCIESAFEGRDRKWLYLAFTAASVLRARILQDIAELRSNPPPPIPTHARYFPAVSKLRKHPSTSDEYFNFEIKHRYKKRQPYCLLYVAETTDKQSVLIKFTRQYSIELHEFCAKSGHAPQILAFERLPGGWYAVAMEYIEFGIPITHPDVLADKRLNQWIEELQHLVDKFHLAGLVHGDLRGPNILCKDAVILIDFDWGGKDGKVFYPTANLNDALLEDRMSKDLRITKEDDRRVLEKTLANLGV